jgi:prepilin-type N-terminal cleavage/methylation domain-containing protein
MKASNFPKNRGFSLIEVLVALVVLSVGLLALAALQLTLIRSSADAKAQSVALSLASQKIDDLRAFQSMDQYRLRDSLANEALNDSGGDQGGINYTRDTVIRRFVFDKSVGTFIRVPNTATDTAISANTCGPAIVGGNTHQCISGKDFKVAEVAVSWRDASGASQSVSVEDAFGSIDPGDSARVSKNTTGTSARVVQVRINNPAGEAGVIPIAINTNDPNAPVSTAATNPRPDVLTRNTNTQYVVETRFDVLTYAGLTGGNYLAQSRVETSAIQCTCSTQLGTNTPTGFRPTYWNGSKYVAPSLATYNEPAGWTQANSAQSQKTESDKCSACCRDHHDPSGVTGAKFDPRRVESTANDGANQAHTHYKLLVNGTRQTLADSGGVYTESCRLIRVDGIFRVAADMYSEYHNLLAVDNDPATTTVPDFAPTATAITSYQNLVLGYLDGRVVTNTDETAYNDPSLTSIGNLESSTSINPADISMPAVGGSKWMHSRGLYIDYLEPAARTAITRARDACKGTDGQAPDTNAEREACILPFVPFTSINLTELASWTPIQGDQIVVVNNDFLCSVAVTDTDCSSVNNAEPVRGKAKSGGNPTNGTSEYAFSNMLSSNAGLALLQYDIDDNPWTVAGNSPPPSNAFDKQRFTISGNSQTGATYKIDPNLWTYSQSNPSVATSPAATCNAQGFTNNGNVSNVDGNDLKYVCTTQDIAGSPLAITFGSYNRAVQSDSNAQNSGSLTLNGCVGPGGVLESHTWTGQNGGQGNPNVYPVRVCKNYQITAASPAATTIVQGPTGVNDGSVNETTTISWTATPLTPNATIGVTVVDTTNAASVKKPTTCSWTIGTCNGNCTPPHIYTANLPAASVCN